MPTLVLVPAADALPLPADASSPFPRFRRLALAGHALIAVFVVGFIGWASFAPLESAAIASGIVEAESSRKTIQHLEGGIIAEIAVSDGEPVRPGQTLIRLDDTKPRTQLAALEAQYWDALAREARLLAERDGLPRITVPAVMAERAAEPTIAAAIAGQQKIFDTRRELLASKTALVQQRIAQVDEEIAGVRAQETGATKRIALILQEIAAVREMVNKGLERRPRLLALERSLAEIEGKRGEAVAQISKAQQSIIENEVNILTLRNDSQKEIAASLRETQNQLHQLAERLQAAADVLARTEVRAPQAGIVTDLRVKTTGGVIAAGEPLLDLVPQEDRLIVTVQVRPEDIDLVRPGLPAQMRLLPYKSRRTPPLDGIISYVSADRLIDKTSGRAFYAARIAVDEERHRHMTGIELVPGMPVEAIIKTGDTTVALYALAPLLDSFHRAFRED